MLPSEGKDTARLETLGEKINDYNKNLTTSTALALADFILFAIVVFDLETQSLKEYWYALLIFALILIAPTVVFFKRSRELRRTNQEMYAFRVYQIYKDISDYVGEESERKIYLDRAKSKLKRLLIEINSWASLSAPEPLWEPTRNFAQNLRDMIIPTLEKGKREDVVKIRFFMLDFAFALLHSFKYSTLNDLNEIIKAISIKQEQPKVEPKQELAPKRTKYKDVMIGVPLWGGLFALGYHLSEGQLAVPLFGATAVTLAFVSYIRRR